MSEIAKTQTQPIEEEASRFAEIQTRTREIIEIAVVNSRIAVQGLRNYLSEKRYDKAVDTMERMDHKDALYEHLGILALGEGEPTLIPVRSSETGVVHRDPTGKPPGPRTMFERIKDRRLDKKAQKLQEAADMRYLAYKISGGTENKGYDKRFARGKRERAAKREGKKQNLTAREIRGAVAKSRTEIQRGESGIQSQSRRKLNQETRTVKRSIKEPVLSRWRNGRKERAKGRIKQNYVRKAQNKEKNQILYGEKRALEIERQLKRTPQGRKIIRDQYENK